MIFSAYGIDFAFKEKKSLNEHGTKRIRFQVTFHAMLFSVNVSVLEERNLKG